MRRPRIGGEPLGTRYPCSDTCTHDDAGTPCHPERVKAKSEAFAKDGVCTCGPGKVATWRKQPHGEECPAKSNHTPDAYRDGVEETREAVRLGVAQVLQHFGLRRTPLEDALMAAIEDAGEEER